MDWGAKFDPVFRKTWPIRPPDLNSRRKLGERTINVNCAEFAHGSGGFAACDVRLAPLNQINKIIGDRDAREDQLDDSKAAMKAGDKQRVGTLRLINAAIQSAEIEADKKPIDDAAVLAVMTKMVKQRRDSIRTIYQWRPAGSGGCRTGRNRDHRSLFAQANG